MAIPQQTGTITTTAAPMAITQGPELWCPKGQIAIYTTDCTMGTSVSYCYSPDRPVECEQGFFPSVWHPDHCMEQSTCFPLKEPWITTSCSNGAIPFWTSTIYDGTLAGGHSTVIKDQWYSMTQRDGSSHYDTFCMPHSYCPRGMTTSVSLNEYCATQLAGFCKCAHAKQTPVYPDWPGAWPTGCKF
ncbi:uncharacterized protein N7515_000777 [Penicillium bovifimosum]|uniref:Uncharacterized protein n=1 Tax=Penicillium bovifimosum TaxID=126998 RepID=A0A9W9LBV7_9EURO|nr:uncharacterized protein N7515_000777 [Penicillium bovifimosum]KAJ5146213.1 hypothetical protein N7515_000777 [Penicillium bovifimosum]